VLGGWQRRNVAATLPAVLDHVEGGEAFTNLARLAGDSDKGFRGMTFTDTDIYKTLEAIAWAAGAPETDGLTARADALVRLLAKVQEDDGYLNSRVQGSPDIERWSDPQEGHELYSAGHLFQAAVAAASTNTLPGLVEVALRFADLLVARFATDDDFIDGHPEVEMALVELYRVTGHEEYLALAERQLDRRGHGWLGNGPHYFTDDRTQDSVFRLFFARLAERSNRRRARSSARRRLRSSRRQSARRHRVAASVGSRPGHRPAASCRGSPR